MNEGNTEPTNSLELTLKLLIENLQTINSVLNIHSETNQESQEEIIKKLSNLPMELIINKLKEIKEGHDLTAEIVNRIASSKRIDINPKDVDFVIAELIVDAYASLAKRKKYVILKEIGFWLFGILMASGIGLILTKLGS